MQIEHGDDFLLTWCGTEELPPPDTADPVTDAYRKDVDVTLLRQNLRLSPEERLQKMTSFTEMLAELRAAARKNLLK